MQCWYIWYLSLVHLVSVEGHLVFLGIWLRVFMVHDWELVFVKWLWSDWCTQRMFVSKDLMSSPCEGYYTCSWLYLYGTWIERHRYILLRNMYEDVCTWHNYMLDTMKSWMLSWKEATKSPSFNKSEKPYLSEGIRKMKYRQVTYIRGL